MVLVTLFIEIVCKREFVGFRKFLQFKHQNRQQLNIKMQRAQSNQYCSVFAVYDICFCIQ